VLLKIELTCCDETAENDVVLIKTKSLPPDISSDQLKSETGRMAKISLKNVSEDIAKKISGESNDTSTKTKSKSLLD
jgi:hypothetical protein